MSANGRFLTAKRGACPQRVSAPGKQEVVSLKELRLSGIKVRLFLRMVKDKLFAKTNLSF